MLKGLDPDKSWNSVFAQLILDASLGAKASGRGGGLGTFITLSFFSSGCMQNLRIFTNGFLSSYFLESVLAQLLYKHKDLRFSISGDEKKHSEDFDIYFLPYQLPKQCFIEEKLAESKASLYAHSAYIERAGLPKKLADLDDHVLVRSKDSTSACTLGVQKFKTIKDYLPTLYTKRFIEVESFNSLLNLAKMGSGIVALTDITHNATGANLEKISPLEEERDFVYRNFTFGFHQKHKSNPLVQDIERELRIMFSNHSH
jgi:DNA-binding transcriptional LysR family regulator